MAGKKPIVILGAGMSGLSTAVSLSQQGHQVVILEARNRTGGRINTLTGPDLPCPVDAGASFIHGCDGNPLADLAKKHNIALALPDVENGGIAYSGKGPPFPEEKAALFAIRIFSTVLYRSRLASQCELNPEPHESLAAWLYARDSPLLEDLEDDEREIVRTLTNVFSGYTGAELSKIQLRWWGFEQDFDGVDAVVQEGYHAFIKILEVELQKKGGDIRLEREVVGVKLEEDESVTVLHRAAGRPNSQTETLTASHVVCTFPLGVLQSLDTSFFSPPLPPRRQQSLSRIGFGLLNKVILAYDKPFWPEEPAWIEFMPREEDISASDPVLSRAFGVQNYVPINGKPVLVVFGGADFGEALEREEPDQLEQRLRRKFTYHFFHGQQGKEAPKAKKCIITKWRSDPWAKGSYIYLPVGQEGKAAEAATPLDLLELSRPLWEGRLGFAGEATSLDHCASVHGPYLTGQREAKRLHVLLTSESQ